MKYLFALIVASPLLLTACAPDGNADADGRPPCTGPACAWPGGSLDGWDNTDGVRQAWDRSHSGGSDDYGEAGFGGAGGAPAAGEPGVGGGDSSEFAGAGGAGGAGGAPPAGLDTSDRTGGGAPLEGGEIDDNHDHDAFLDFAQSVINGVGADDPSIRWLDVSERYYIRVVDRAGRHVPDATVMISTGLDHIFGRTRADGSFAYFPLAYGPQMAEQVFIWTEFGEGNGPIVDGNTIIALDGVRPEQDSVAIDVSFIVDATGSMSGELDRIKTTITEIAGRISEKKGVGTLRFGLVDYRDRGDAYITHAVDFTDDINAFEAAIGDVRAAGGGDFPEDLNAALRDGMRRLDWRPDTTLRIAFVVADAPAHHYEQQGYRYDQAMIDAARMGVKIFPIASGGSDPVAELQFRQLAHFTQGHFIFITEGQGSSHGSEGSEYHVDEDQFRVERLDDLLVRLVGEEVEDWLAAVDAELL